jgi:hypothetical protein
LNPARMAIRTEIRAGLKRGGRMYGGSARPHFGHRLPPPRTAGCERPGDGCERPM